MVRGFAHFLVILECQCVSCIYKGGTEKVKGSFVCVSKSYCLVDLEAGDEEEPCCFVGEPALVVTVCESFGTGLLVSCKGIFQGCKCGRLCFRSQLGAEG